MLFVSRQQSAFLKLIVGLELAGDMGCLGGGKSNSSGSDSDTKFKLLSVRWEIAADPIGEGGFGSVHLATNRKTGKVCLRLGRWLRACARACACDCDCALACTSTCTLALAQYQTKHDFALASLRPCVVALSRAGLLAACCLLPDLYLSRCERSRQCASRRLRSGRTSITRSSS